MTMRPRAYATIQFLAIWTAILFCALILAVFLHEDGHGLGARLDGIHVSTGFNRIGNAGRAPGDPDFRTDTLSGVFTGLLGPMTSWVLAIVFTLWLTRLKKPGRAALLIGAFAVVNAVARAIPMWNVFSAAIAGRVVLEDESYWGVWYIGKIVRPELGLSGALGIVDTQPGTLLSYPAIWTCVLVSLLISLACLVVAYRHLLDLEKPILHAWPARAAFVLLPISVWFLTLPLLNALDRVFRINW